MEIVIDKEITRLWVGRSHVDTSSIWQLSRCEFDSSSQDFRDSRLLFLADIDYDIEGSNFTTRQLQGSGFRAM